MAGSEPKYKWQDMAAACEGTGGIKALVARKLDCSRSTVVNYAKRYARVRQALEDAKQARIDLAEGQHTRLIVSGYWPAIKYLLETQGRDRGYTERHEITGADGAEIAIRVIGGVNVEDV